MRMMLATLTALALTTVALAARAADEAEEDLKQLEGRWTAKIGAGKGLDLMMEIKGKSLTLKFSDKDQERVFKGDLAIDATKNPKTMDWLKMTVNGTSIPDNHAIYRLNKDGTLDIRGSVPPGNERPKEFDEKDEKGKRQILNFSRTTEKAEVEKPEVKEKGKTSDAEKKGEKKTEGPKAEQPKSAEPKTRAK